MLAISCAGAGRGTVAFAGMAPLAVSLTTADGVTSFPLEDTMSCYVSDRTKAAEASKTLR
jgi:hypothetical protein